MGSSESRRFITQLSRISPDGSNTGMTVQMGSVTNSDGSFAFNAVTPGDYVIVALAVEIGPQSGPSAGQASGPAERRIGFTRVRMNDSDMQMNVTVFGPSEVKGRIIVAGVQGPPPPGVRFSLQSQFPASGLLGGGQIAALDANGNFDLRGVTQGEFNFNVAISNQSTMYVKQVTCASKDYTFQPLVIESPMTLSDCVITLGADAGSIAGQVSDSTGPVQGLVVVAIPETRALRSIARFVTTARTDDKGQFTLAGVIPGDYLVYAVQYNDEQSYFAPDFADANENNAERVTVHASENKTVNPKPPAIH
jgi:hypothetical protein